MGGRQEQEEAHTSQKELFFVFFFLRAKPRSRRDSPQVAAGGVLVVVLRLRVPKQHLGRGGGPLLALGEGGEGWGPAGLPTPRHPGHRSRQLRPRPRRLPALLWPGPGRRGLAALGAGGRPSPPPARPAPLRLARPQVAEGGGTATGSGSGRRGEGGPEEGAARPGRAAAGARGRPLRDGGEPAALSRHGGCHPCPVTATAAMSLLPWLASVRPSVKLKPLKVPVL